MFTISETEHLSLSEDGVVYRSRPIERDGEDVDWERLCAIDDDYSVDDSLVEEFALLQSEWRDYRRHNGEVASAGWGSWFFSRGTFA